MTTTLDEAIAAAASHYPDNQWIILNTGEQTRAIYREMQRLDLAQAQRDGRSVPVSELVSVLGDVKPA